MARLLKFGVLAFLALGAWADDDEAEPLFAEGDEADAFAAPAAPIPSARLIVDKTILEERLVEGKDFTVQIKIYNVGDLPASDIELNDGGWSEVMTTSSGGGKATISKLAPQQNYTHTYKTSVGPVAQLASNAAQVKYKAIPGSAEFQTSISSPIYGVTVLSKGQYYRSVAVTAGAFATLGFIKTEDQWRNLIILIFVFGGLLSVNQGILKTRGAIKQRNSRRALKELQKLE